MMIAFIIRVIAAATGGIREYGNGSTSLQSGNGMASPPAKAGHRWEASNIQALLILIFIGFCYLFTDHASIFDLCGILSMCSTLTSGSSKVRRH